MTALNPRRIAEELKKQVTVQPIFPAQSGSGEHCTPTAQRPHETAGLFASFHPDLLTGVAWLIPTGR